MTEWFHLEIECWLEFFQGPTHLDHVPSDALYLLQHPAKILNYNYMYLKFTGKTNECRSNIRLVSDLLDLRLNMDETYSTNKYTYSKNSVEVILINPQEVTVVFP